jgi:hypothetical protein
LQGVDLAAELAIEGGVDETVLLDAAQPGEGVRDHARIEMHVVRRLHVGRRAGNTGLDAGFDFAGSGHLRKPRVATAILCEV